MLIISRLEFDKMRAHLEAGYPNEACGLIVGEFDGERRRAAYVVPARNAWTPDDASAAHSQRDRFVIAPDDYVHADREAATRGLDVIGYFHSHPDWPSRPSETDREFAWPGVSYVIVSVDNGRATSAQSWVVGDDGQFREEVMSVDNVA